MSFLKKCLRPTNNRLRLVLGLGLLAVICLQCASPSEAFRENQYVQNVDGNFIPADAADRVARLEELARTDQIALLNLCIENYDRTISDYTCTLIKQERINGRVGQEQHIDVKFLQEPFSVAMLWTQNAPISDRLLYVEGENVENGVSMMLLKPKGLLSWVGTVKRDPEGEEVMSNTLRPVTLFGFRRGLVSLVEVYELAQSRDELETEYMGLREVNGRQTLMLRRTLPPRDDYPAEVTDVYIDAELLVPVCIEAADWGDQFESRYIYTDIRTNVGLTPADFTEDANGF